MTIQEIKNIVTGLIPATSGRVALSGTTWNIATNPQVEKTLSANTAITLSGAANGISQGVAFITGAGFTLTINGASVTLAASGVTAVSVFVLISGSVYISSDAGSTASAALALDSISSVLGAYSLRKLRTAYSGNAIKVRRASDNTTSNIGFASTGVLDTTALNTFISGTTGFIDTWYDQSGNGKDATQATTTSQQQILVNSFNGLPSLKHDGVDDVLGVASSTGSFTAMHANKASAIIVQSAGLASDPNALGVLLGNNGLSSAKIGFSVWYDDRASSSRNNAFVTHVGNGVSGQTPVTDVNNNAIPAQTPTIITALFDNTNATAALRSEQYINDGTLLTQNNTFTNTPSSASATHDLQIGAGGASTFFYAGYIAEVILIGDKIGSTARAALIANQKSYYNIL